MNGMGARWWVLRLGGAALLMMIVVAYTTTRNPERMREQRQRAAELTYNHSRLLMINYKNTELVDKSLTTAHMNYELVRGVVHSIVVPGPQQHSVMNPPTTITVVVKQANDAPSLLKDSLITTASTAASPRPGPELTPPPLTETFTPLTRKDIEGVETFVLFVGFARSGHSIVGSLLDAHPDIIIAHEYNVLRDIKSVLRREDSSMTLFNNLYSNSHRNALKGCRTSGKSEKGYDLSMSDQTWQGRVHRLRVIGDKAAGMAAQQHITDPTKCPYLVDRLNSTIGASVKTIRVLRNPYDIISTRVLYKKLGKADIVRAKNSSQPVKFNQPEMLGRNIHRFFELASHVNRMITECHLPFIDVHSSDLVHNPQAVMRDLCQYLGVQCSVGYVEACAEKVFKQLSKTRSVIEWSQRQIDNVAENIRKYPEFSRYTYDCDC